MLGDTFFTKSGE